MWKSDPFRSFVSSLTIMITVLAASLVEAKTYSISSNSSGVFSAVAKLDIVEKSDHIEIAVRDIAVTHKDSEHVNEKNILFISIGFDFFGTVENNFIAQYNQDIEYLYKRNGTARSKKAYRFYIPKTIWYLASIVDLNITIDYGSSDIDIKGMKRIYDVLTFNTEGSNFLKIK